jgi:hypothetical protein
MFGALWDGLTDVEYLKYLISSPLALAGVLFQLWMLIDALRRREWIWAVFIAVFSVISALLYFFMVYRAQGGLATRGFELPGAHSRRRIKELKAQIHHLDKPHHHLALGDIYFQQGKLDLAETEYRAALERDGEDRDTRSHLGQCLLRKKKPGEAQPLLEGVTKEDPKHDYGYTMMALAETYMALGHTDAAIQVWERLLQNYSYARARVQLAELYIAKNQIDAAREQILEVIETDAHAPAFDRKRNRIWLRRAKKLRSKVSG